MGTVLFESSLIQNRPRWVYGKILINGKEVKRLVFDGSDDELGVAFMNILINNPEHFDYEIDGEPVTVKDMKEMKSQTNPIKNIEYVAKDDEHPKDRLLITTKKTE